MNSEKDKKDRILTGKRLKALRIRAKLSQVDLAKIIGVCVNTIISWEKGRTSVYSRHLCKLHRLYNVTIDYILAMSDNENQTSQFTKK